MLDLRESGQGRQRRSHDPGLAGTQRNGPGDPLPCVLLVTRAADREATIVEILLRKISIPCLRLDAESAGTAGLLIDLAGRAVRLHDQWIRPTVTWVRHFSARTLADHRGAATETFLRDSWRALVSQLAVISGTAISSDGPGLLAQLTLAAASDIRTPRTVVAAAPGQAAALLPAGRHIVKPLHQHFVEASPGLLTGVFPELADIGVLGDSGELRGPPVVVQEYVEHDLELRVYYVRGEILAFEVSKSSPADPWVSPERVEVRAADPPPAVLAATGRLAAALSLEYGAFDFLVTDGTPTFLEVNLSGDWRWIEKRIKKAPVTTAVTRMLRDVHLGAAGRDSGSGSIRLTTFLSG